MLGFGGRGIPRRMKEKADGGHEKVLAEIVGQRWPECGGHCWLTVTDGGYLSEEEEAMGVEGKEEEEGEEGMMFNFILFIRAFWTFHV